MCFGPVIERVALVNVGRKYILKPLRAALFLQERTGTVYFVLNINAP